MSACCPAALTRGRLPSGGGGSSFPAGAPGYELAAEIDFASFDIPAIADSPAVTALGGVDFFGFNSPVATTWSIVPGVGLRFQALGVGGTTQWLDGGGGQNATNLRVQLSEFIPDFDPTRRYLFQLQLTANNGDAASERVCFSIVRPVGVPTGAIAVAMAWTFSGSTAAAVMGGFGSSSSGGTGSTDYTFANGYDVLSFTVSPASGSAVQGYLAQSVGGTWPPQTGQRPVTGNQLTGAPLAITAAEFLDPRCQLAIAFPTGNNSGTFSATVRRMRALVAA